MVPAMGVVLGCTGRCQKSWFPMDTGGRLHGCAARSPCPRAPPCAPDFDQAKRQCFRPRQCVTALGPRLAWLPVSPSTLPVLIPTCASFCPRNGMVQPECRGRHSRARRGGTWTDSLLAAASCIHGTLLGLCRGASWYTYWIPTVAPSSLSRRAVVQDDSPTDSRCGGVTVKCGRPS